MFLRILTANCITGDLKTSTQRKSLIFIWKLVLAAEGQERWLEMAKERSLGVFYNSLDERRQSHFFEVPWVALLHKSSLPYPETHGHTHTHAYAHTYTHIHSLFQLCFASTLELAVYVLFLDSGSDKRKNTRLKSGYMSRGTWNKW